MDSSSPIKIISGGQTGADQAALDAAISLGLPHGGWITKGRKTETGPCRKNIISRNLPPNVTVIERKKMFWSVTAP